jgi:RecA/RadA recombinase
MPTVSAAQALEDLKSPPTQCISTGVSLLDYALQNREPQLPETEPFYGGVSRGKVTEVYGPPGVGKTSLGLVKLQFGDSDLLMKKPGCS